MLKSLDLQYSFVHLLTQLGFSENTASILWIPFPILAVVIAAFLGVLVVVLI